MTSPIHIARIGLTLGALSGCLEIGVTGVESTSGGPSSGGLTSGSSSTSGGMIVLPPGPCGPGTVWVGDTCVTQNCAYPSARELPCALSDGGVGVCYGPACLSPGDPNNCGGLGVVCPTQDFCRTLHLFGFEYCASFPDAGLGGTSCQQASCPSELEQCVDNLGCVLAMCGGASDNLACIANDGGVGFCCGGSCHSSDPDPENCGGCAISCGASAACSGLTCVPTGDCSDGLQLPCRLSTGVEGFCCDGQCNGCGGCGLACPIDGRACTSDAMCPEGYACLYNDCVKLDCVGSSDGAPCAFLDAGYFGECCAGLCSSTDQDSANCGGCGITCGPDEMCGNGLCQAPNDCAMGGDAPNGTCFVDGGRPGTCCGMVCVDVVIDAENCGSCGVGCPVGGSCSSPSGYAVSNCVSDGGAQLKCGPGTSCPAGTSCVSAYNGSATCVRSACDGANSFCILGDGGSGLCCGTTCTPATGLGCGGTCPSGTTLSPTSGCIAPDGGIPSCFGAMCPPGTACLDTACVPLSDCEPATQTPGFGGCLMTADGFGECCGETCVDASQDPNNCGGCDVVCPSGVCIEAPDMGDRLGICLPPGPTNDCLVTCAQGSLCLNGWCTDGLCGFPYNFGSFCAAENGTIGVCCPSGACAHPLDDPQNCGSCGNDCGPGASCVGGSCTSFPGCGLGQMNVRPRRSPS